jgi:hypothetical protein
MHFGRSMVRDIRRPVIARNIIRYGRTQSANKAHNHQRLMDDSQEKVD